jgi:hypothetical protein
LRFNRRVKRCDRAVRGFIIGSVVNSLNYFYKRVLQIQGLKIPFIQVFDEAGVTAIKGRRILKKFTALNRETNLFCTDFSIRTGVY